MSALLLVDAPVLLVRLRWGSARGIRRVVNPSGSSRDGPFFPLLSSSFSSSSCSNKSVRTTAGPFNFTNHERLAGGGLRCQRPECWVRRDRLRWKLDVFRELRRGTSSKSDGQGQGNVGPSAPQKKPLISRLRNPLARENIYNLPNALTFSRLIVAPVVGYLVLHDQHAWALGLFAYAGITDLIDGFIARRWKLQTVVGTVIDPMADKILMTILTVCLAIKGVLPVWLAVIILGRDVGLGIAAIYYRYISLPPPKTFSRYWDFSLPSAEVRPTTISKINTALQLALIGACTAQPLITADISSAMTVMQYVVASTTIWSGASYVYSQDAVKILSQPDRKVQERSGNGKSH